MDKATGQQGCNGVAYDAECTWPCMLNYFPNTPLTAPIYLYALTNAELQSIRHDALVKSPTIVSYAITNGVTNAVYAKHLSPENGGEVLAFALFRDTNDANVVQSATTTQLGLHSPIVTVRSPWSHAIEFWATNTVTFNAFGENWIPNLNVLHTPSSRLYKITEGFQTPTWLPGTNYLSDWYWRLNATNVPYRDMREYDKAPIVINGITYAKGFIFPSGQTYWYDSPMGAAYFEFPLGGVCSNFSCAFGLWDAWNPSSAGFRLTVYGDGNILFRSLYISDNAAGATNCSVNVNGVMTLAFLLESSNPSVTMQPAMGNVQVTVSEQDSMKSLIRMQKRNVISGFNP